MQHGDSPECCMILLNKGADPNALDDYGVAPLATAAGTGGDQCIDLLIQFGADINHRDCDSSTALH
jgi:ankyrin repeat protein